jgi:very-short-patch-repair endonuclease
VRRSPGWALKISCDRCAHFSDIAATSRPARGNCATIPLPPSERLWFDFLSTHPKKFTRQKPLARYIADFYCAQARLVVEVDGDSHFSGAGEQHDGRRTEELALLGIRVIRFDNLEVMQQFEGVCARIDEALAD